MLLVAAAVSGMLMVAVPQQADAHPGNTDSRGCHTCRTNCGRWGLNYGEYHCHNSRRSSSPAGSTYNSGPPTGSGPGGGLLDSGWFWLAALTSPIWGGAIIGAINDQDKK